MGGGKPIGPIPNDGFHWGDGRVVKLVGGVPPGDHVGGGGLTLCVGVSAVDVVEGNRRVGVVENIIMDVVGSGEGYHIGKRDAGQVVAEVGHGGSCQWVGVVIVRGAGRVGGGRGCHCGVGRDRGVLGNTEGVAVKEGRCGGPWVGVPPDGAGIGGRVNGPVFIGRELRMCRTWSNGWSFDFLGAGRQLS